MKWRSIYLATRNLFTVVGAIAIGAWFPNQDWNIGIISAVMVGFIWWILYRLALVKKVRSGRHGSARSETLQRSRSAHAGTAPLRTYGRIRQPGKRAVASWARFVRDVQEEKADRRAGELAY